MTPTNIKKTTAWVVLLLTGLFLSAEGMARSATPVKPATEQISGNTFSAPVPPKTVPTPAITPTTAGTRPNAGPSSCPIPYNTGPKGDIRDIRGPIHIPDPILLIFYALGGILLLLPAWAAWKWFSKRQLSRSKEAFEIAFEELEKAKALMKPETAEQFSVMVSSAIRTYIEKRFRMKATRKTTSEFMVRVAAEPDGELNLHREPLREFLTHCDLAKFARQAFSHEQMKQMHRSAYGFVEETRPQPETKTRKINASSVNDTATEAETSTGAGTDKKRFFTGRIRGNFPWMPKMKAKHMGIHDTHHAVAAGGR